MTIPVFVASSDRFAQAEWLTPFSIKENTQHNVAIHIVRPQWFGMSESGCTGFSLVRYAIPEICREMGYPFGIYLDVDMLVLGDVADLYEYRRRGEWVCLQDGSNEVSVICSSMKFPYKGLLHGYGKRHLSAHKKTWLIPKAWNVEDRVVDDMRLLHFTDLNTQPWFYNHPNQEAVALYEEYRERHLGRNRP